jgi:hypothetical protein
MRLDSKNDFVGDAAAILNDRPFLSSDSLCNYLTISKDLVLGPNGRLTPRQNGRLIIGCNITLIFI